MKLSNLMRRKFYFLVVISIKIISLLLIMVGGILIRGDIIAKGFILEFIILMFTFVLFAYLVINSKENEKIIILTIVVVICFCMEILFAGGGAAYCVINSFVVNSVVLMWIIPATFLIFVLYVNRKCFD